MASCSRFHLSRSCYIFAEVKHFANNIIIIFPWRSTSASCANQNNSEYSDCKKKWMLYSVLLVWWKYVYRQRQWECESAFQRTMLLPQSVLEEYTERVNVILRVIFCESAKKSRWFKIFFFFKNVTCRVWEIFDWVGTWWGLGISFQSDMKHEGRLRLLMKWGVF